MILLLMSELDDCASNEARRLIEMPINIEHMLEDDEALSPTEDFMELCISSDVMLLTYGPKPEFYRTGYQGYTCRCRRECWMYEGHSFIFDDVRIFSRTYQNRGG